MGHFAYRISYESTAELILLANSLILLRSETRPDIGYSSFEILLNISSAFVEPMK